MNSEDKAVLGRIVQENGVDSILRAVAEACGGSHKPPSRPDKNDLQCSFCEKRGDEVANLIAGRGVYICVECVALCNTIIATESAPVAA